LRFGSIRSTHLLLGKKNFFATPYGRGPLDEAYGSMDALIGASSRVLLEQSYRTVASRRMVTALDRMGSGQRAVAVAVVFKPS